jgi:glutamate-1-semialdehyde 2,1-aminomutase
MSDRDLFERALRTAPGGVHSPVRAFHGVGGTPVFMSSAAGAYITDTSGRRYIDFCLSFGPLILGHRDPVVAAAAHAAIEDGWSYGACEPYSLALAEWIIGQVPWVEKLRFVSSGTEAVMSALRVARAATGRSTILKFEGCYHGHADSLLVRAGSGLAGATAATSAGLPTGVLGQTIVAPLDDEAALAETIAAAGHDLAAIIIEPVPANYGLLLQRREWIDSVCAAARRVGAPVIFDEVISGFRSGIRGAAGFYHLQPDLVCYGKVIGGGFPVAAYGGRAALMDLVAPVGPVYQAGTLSANPVGMRAGLASLERMVVLGGWRELGTRTEEFCRALEADFAHVSTALAVARHESIFWIHLRDGSEIRRPDHIPASLSSWYRRFFHAALDRGVYLAPSAYEVGFTSMAHDVDVLRTAKDALVAAAREAATAGDSTRG